MFKLSTFFWLLASTVGQYPPFSWVMSCYSLALCKQDLIPCHQGTARAALNDFVSCGTLLKRFSVFLHLTVFVLYFSLLSECECSNVTVPNY